MSSLIKAPVIVPPVPILISKANGIVLVPATHINLYPNGGYLVDNYNKFDYINNLYVIPVAGIYRIKSDVTIGATGINKFLWLRILVNNVEVLYKQFYNLSGNIQTNVALDLEISLGVGDTITNVAYINNAIARTTYNSTLSIYKIN